MFEHAVRASLPASIIHSFTHSLLWRQELGHELPAVVCSELLLLLLLLLLLQKSTALSKVSIHPWGPCISELHPESPTNDKEILVVLLLCII